jgi:hypothetical protein
MENPFYKELPRTTPVIINVCDIDIRAFSKFTPYEFVPDLFYLCNI